MPQWPSAKRSANPDLFGCRQICERQVAIRAIASKIPIVKLLFSSCALFSSWKLCWVLDWIGDSKVMVNQPWLLSYHASSYPAPLVPQPFFKNVMFARQQLNNPVSISLTISCPHYTVIVFFNIPPFLAFPVICLLIFFGKYYQGSSLMKTWASKMLKALLSPSWTKALSGDTYRQIEKLSFSKRRMLSQNHIWCPRHWMNPHDIGAAIFHSAWDKPNITARLSGPHINT